MFIINKGCSLIGTAVLIDYGIVGENFHLRKRGVSWGDARNRNRSERIKTSFDVLRSERTV